MSRILADQQGEAWVRLCVETTCDSTSMQDGRQLDAVFVDGPSIGDTGPVDVELKIEDGSGAPIYQGQTTVELERVQPNGPDCPPTKYSATLVADGQGDLGVVAG